MDPGDDKPADMGDIGHEHRAAGFGYLAELGEVYLPGIRAGPADDEPGFVLPGKTHDLVVVDPLGLAVHIIKDDIKKPARNIDRVAVGQVPSVGKVHGKDRVAGIED